MRPTKRSFLLTLFPPLCPTLSLRAQTQMKIRLKGAKTGHSLLKKKSDALTMRFRDVLRQIIKVRAKEWEKRRRRNGEEEP
jgi:vacuolar-type H+-ATPase subunit D/Vma8